MKWLLRILLAAMLLMIAVGAVAWYAFPRYAQLLIDRAVEGKNISIQVDNPGMPGLGGIPFGKLEITFDAPPDSCSKAPASYTLVAYNGSLTWKRQAPLTTTGLIPESLHLDLALKADSVSIFQETANLSFIDNEPSMTGSLKVLRKNGFVLEFQPESFDYEIENGRFVSNKLMLEGISYKLSLDRQGNWLQKPALLTVASLYSENEPAPLSNFEALFGMEKDPENPCGLTFEECSVDLFDFKAKTPRIEYNPVTQETGFTLLLQSLPLEKLPGLKGKEPARPFATGQLSGNIPVEFRDSTLRIRNATIRADADTKLLYYSLDGKPWLSIEAGTSNKASDLFRNLNAEITLNSEDEQLPGIALKRFSATFLGGSLSSTPAVYDPIGTKNSFTLKLDNVRLPEHIHLHGDFEGSMNGTISGIVPVTVKNGKVSIRNARLTSKGSGSILHAPAQQKKSTKESIFTAPGTDATYTFSEPDFNVSRDPEGKTKINFTLQKLTRKTSGGELQFSSPKGVLDLWQNKNNPSLISLSEFSAGFMGGSIAIDNVDYDMGKKTAETELIVNNIPLQKLLDLQGVKKIYATGSIRGKIPITMKDQLFEISAGNMDAEQTGKIVYSTTPEERAAANESMRLTYEALSNFLYSELISSISMAPDGQSLIRLELKGVNPSFQEGRPVHLNLNVEQNLLDLLRSLTIPTNIEKALLEKSLQKKPK